MFRLTAQKCLVRMILTIAAGLAVQPTSDSQQVDKSVLPEKYQTLPGSQGSAVALSGKLKGKASSAKSVLLSVLDAQKASLQFDNAPMVQAVLADDSDQHAQALFTGAMRDTQLTGIASVDLTNSGGTVNLVYDLAQSFPDSYSRMRQAFVAAAGAQYANAQLVPRQLADGSIISIPDGWYITSVNRGSVDLSGPDGEYVSLGAHAPVYSYPQPATFVAPCCDPVRAYQMIYAQISASGEKAGLPPQRLVAIVQWQPAPPVPNGQAAYILSEIDVAGRPYLAYNYVVAARTYGDPWEFYFSSVSAPKEIFQNVLPVMMEIWKSYRTNQNALINSPGQGPQSVPVSANAAIMEKLNADNSRISQSVTQSWNEILRTTNVSQVKASGRLNVDKSVAVKLTDALSAQTGSYWRVVPPSDLAGKQ